MAKKITDVSENWRVNAVMRSKKLFSFIFILQCPVNNVYFRIANNLGNPFLVYSPYGLSADWGSLFCLIFMVDDKKDVYILRTVFF